MKPIAVTGVGALFPGNTEPDGFWRTIISGRDCLTDIPESHWLIEDYYDPDPAKPGKTYVKRGAFLSPVLFEPLEHGIPPNQVPSTDTAQLLALMVAKRVLESSCGLQFRNVDPERVSVILGVASATELVSTMSGSLQRPVLLKALRESGIPDGEAEEICARVAGSYVDWTEGTFPGLLGNVVAGRIANRFDLGGTNCVVDAACASSLGAVQMAMQELWSGSSDMVITGGVDAINDIFMFMCFSKTLAMSKSGDCRPFAEDSDGTMLGEGIGMFALRRLEDAERDGDGIYAVLRGIGSSSDGRAKSIYAPRPEGQARALRRAYEAAGYGPETVGMVEAHGTGTVAGDAAEVRALRDVFESSAGGTRPWCALGSIKSQIGHTKAAAGAASLYKAVMALHHKVLPGTIKVTRPNPALALDESAFYLNTATRPWIHGKDHPRRAGVSAFGFGGSNFHLALEEYCGTGATPPRIRTLPSELFLVAAASVDAIGAAARTLITRSTAEGFAYTARESQGAFAADEKYRLAIVARDPADLAAKINRVEDSIRDRGDFVLPNSVAFSSAAKLDGGNAFLFPGQGSQYVGMTSELAIAFDEVLAVWDKAAAVAPELTAVVFPPPAFSEEEKGRQSQRLTATENAQPAIGIASEAYLRLLRAAGLVPDFCAGHSFGEVSALFAAGVIGERDFLSVALERGRLMAEAAANCSGAMLAVAAAAAEVEPLLPGGLTIANINGPRQVVVAGSVTEIAQFEETLRGKAFTARRLSVSTAFHSPIVASAAPRFTEFLKQIDFAAPQDPVFANSSAAPYPDDAGSARFILGNQLASPVRFADQIEALYAAGARCFVEVGPGSILSELVGACLKDKPHLAVAVDSKRCDSVTAFWFALAKLAVAGVRVDTAFAWRDYEAEPRQDSKATAMAIPLTGANYGKKYPGENVPVPPAPRRHRTAPEADVTPVPQGNSTLHAAIEQLHRQMAEAHTATQRALSESHLAYLRTSEAAFARLGGVDQGAAFEAIPPVVIAPAPIAVAPIPVAPTPIAPSVTPPPREHLSELVLSIVAEKTGYPRDILVPEMDLEADLGIDSIKRVQILAAVHDARPDLPEMDAQRMAGLRTLAAILDYLGHETEPDVAKLAGVAKGEGIKDLVLSVVAEKTGYPRDILSLDMDLEADLGIDSIKRVQILAAVCDLRPDLPEVDAQGMARLRTLGAILDHLSGGTSAPSPVATSPVIQLPKHLTANGLVRLGMRRVHEAPDGRATANISRVTVMGSAGDSLTEAIAASLRGRGMTVSLTDSARADSDGTIFVDAQGAGRGLAERARDAFRAAQYFTRTHGTKGGVFVTVESRASALRSGLAALVKTVALEYPQCVARAIGIDPRNRSAAETAEIIVGEVLGGSSSAEVVFDQDGSRRVTEDLPLPIGHDHDPSLLADNPVIVVTGGARGVTAACLGALAETAPVRLALLGRTQLETEPAGLEHAAAESELRAALFASARRSGETLSPKDVDTRARQILACREVADSLRRLRSLGAETEYFVSDVTNPESVEDTLRAIRGKWGRVDGLIHGAGVIADKPIVDKSAEQFARVFGTKVAALEALLEATCADDLRFIYLFTSVAGRYGNSGQADYAMANATVSQMAREESAKRGPRCVVRAMSWGPWNGGMVTPDLRSHFAARGVSLIQMDQGVAAFMQELCYTSTDPAGIDVVIAAQSAHRAGGGR